MTDTMVSEVAAEYRTVRGEPFTIVWHTGLTYCDADDPSHDSWPWPSPPRLVELSPGDLELVDTVQCGHCGSRYGTTAELIAGHLEGEDLHAVASAIGDRVEERRDELRGKIAARLAEELRDVLTGNAEPTGSEQWPGVYAPRGGGPMTAWTFDPWRDDLLIEVRLGFA